MNSKFSELKQKLTQIEDIKSAGAVLQWDMATHMPEQSAPSRSRQTALMEQLAHEKLTDPEIGRLLDVLEKEYKNADPDSFEACFLKVTREDFNKATKVPSEFNGRMAQHFGDTYERWTKARPENDFKAMIPYLEKTLDFSRMYSEYFGKQEHIADPLIDLNDPGMSVATVKGIFSELRNELVPLVKTIASKKAVDESSVRKNYPEHQQLKFGTEVIKEIGYDFTRGRQDKTHHPFMTRFSAGDVRITTRVKEHYLPESLFSTIHEAGHALYELGVATDLDGTPLGHGVSAGVHESQSRLWENVVGRSLPFWKYYFPKLQKEFPEQLGNTSVKDFYRAINKVQPSLIRTDADEVTYNLHVMIRFDLELQLLEGRLRVQDLAEAWRSRYHQDLGVSSKDDKDGVLQDVHWYASTIGGTFQGYTIGNIFSAQSFEAATKSEPEILSQIEKGEFSTLRNWLTKNLYQHGRKYKPAEVIQKATGKPLSIGPYLTYLKKKYGEIYEI